MILALVVAALVAHAAGPTAYADFNYFKLATGDLTQNWSRAELLDKDDDWSKVASIAGFRGGNGQQPYGSDPRTILRNFSFAQVDADKRAPSTPSNYNAGGLIEFDKLPNPTVGINATTSADSPHLVIYLDTTGVTRATVEYDVRDLDCSTDDDKKMIATQYRVRRPDAPADPRGDPTPWQNVTDGLNPFIPDATDPKVCQRVTHVVARLPREALNQPRVEVRILTTNNEFLEEVVGIDNIRASSAVAPRTSSRRR